MRIIDSRDLNTKNLNADFGASAYSIARSSDEIGIDRFIETGIYRAFRGNPAR
jgi:hypothetical protein